MSTPAALRNAPSQTRHIPEGEPEPLHAQRRELVGHRDELFQMLRAQLKVRAGLDPRSPVLASASRRISALRAGVKALDRQLTAIDQCASAGPYRPPTG